MCEFSQVVEKTVWLQSCLVFLCSLVPHERHRPIDFDHVENLRESFQNRSICNTDPNAKLTVVVVGIRESQTNEIILVHSVDLLQDFVLSDGVSKYLSPKVIVACIDGNHRRMAAASVMPERGKTFPWLAVVHKPGQSIT